MSSSTKVPVAFCFLLLVTLLTSCSDGSDSVRAIVDVEEPTVPGPGASESLAQTGAVLAKSTQVTGDPVAGREAMLGGAYMQCGVPYKIARIPDLLEILAVQWGNPDILEPLPDRTGNGAELPYWMSTFVNQDSAEVVNANCLLCHGGQFDGELVMGLPNTNADFTSGIGSISTEGIPQSLFDLLGLTVEEQASLDQLVERATVVGPATSMRTVGHNPAEILAITLMLHHERNTLAWSDTPYNNLALLDQDGSDRADDDNTITSDPGPWWRVKKKNALFYNGMARGDHRGTMALASAVCVDDVEIAQAVDQQFVDIQAFVLSVEAPVYQRSINAEQADQGKELFVRDCAACHGTYATATEIAAGMEDTYPNLLIPLDVIGTDPVVAEVGVVHAPWFIEWYNDSFYGQITTLVPDDPFPGYMPPPLDGIWATAPFLHNGSVPTVELVLNSSARPAVWKRVTMDSSDFDEASLGWPYEALTVRQSEVDMAERKFVYDTGYWSQSNSGHTFGDHLSNEERRAVIEYLKTL